MLLACRCSRPPRSAHKPSDAYLTVVRDGANVIGPMGHRVARPRPGARPRRQWRRRDHLGRSARAQQDAIAAFAHARLALSSGGEKCALRADRTCRSTRTPTARMRCCALVRQLRACRADGGDRVLAAVRPRPAASRAAPLRRGRRIAQRRVQRRPLAADRRRRHRAGRWRNSRPMFTKASGTSGWASTTSCSWCRCCCPRCWCGATAGGRPRPDFRAAFWDVAKIVTAFTLAHSITLTLAALGIVSLPSRWSSRRSRFRSCWPR